MKRYEKMSKEEILEKFHEASHAMCDDDCYFANYCSVCNALDCADAVLMWLNEEIEMVPRAWTFKTAEEALSAKLTFKNTYCNITDCFKCRYSMRTNNSPSCTFNWLYEEVEKE